MGCSQPPNPKFVGDWKLANNVPVGTLTLKPDGSFKFVTGADSMSGRWTSDGQKITLFKDVSNGGDAQFGTNQTDQFSFAVAPDDKTMQTAGPVADTGPMIMTKVTH